MSDTQKYLEAVNGYIHALNAGNLDAIVGLYADDATLEDPVGSDLIEGIEGVRTFYSNALAMGIKAKLSGQVRVAGMEAAFPFDITVPGEAAMHINVIDIFRFNEAGKVVSMRAYWGAENCSDGSQEAWREAVLTVKSNPN